MTKKEHLLKVRPTIEFDVFSGILNDVLQAMENYTNEQLILSGVSHQRELLLAFAKYVNGRIFSDNEPFFEDEVDECIANNCG